MPLNHSQLVQIEVAIRDLEDEIIISNRSVFGLFGIFPLAPTAAMLKEIEDDDDLPSI